MGAPAVSLPAGLERALALFEPEQRPASPRLRDGYLDLVDEQGRSKPGFSQRALQGRMVPYIYERIWRPTIVLFSAGFKAPKRREEHRLAVEMLKLSKGDCVLDVACGPGNFTRPFAAAAGDGLVVGLDIATNMLAAGARRTDGQNVAYIRVDACALPFQASSFDAICCFGALHLFEQPMQALDEIVRVLKPGGRVAIMATSARDPKARGSRAPVRKYGGVLIFTRDEVTGELGNRGLVDVEQRVVGGLQFVSALKPA
jgi:SAM-dependent methyltransferase